MEDAFSSVDIFASPISPMCALTVPVNWNLNRRPFPHSSFNPATTCKLKYVSSRSLFNPETT